ncbi:MAG: helix-hairpin-helix domain-containing protein [Lachnospiraceae bacterium]|nr:helix-hairpin-helix domain-containing protein [Lachnospiraceae bacterium]
MDIRNIVCKITATVLFITAGIVYIVMSGREKPAIVLDTGSEDASGITDGTEGRTGDGTRNGAGERSEDGTQNGTGDRTGDGTRNGIGDRTGDVTQKTDISEDDGYGSDHKDGGTDAQLKDDRIDINSADADTLMRLPGIGAVKAEAIIVYRNENGNFTRPEDLMMVPGIKEGTFTKLKDRIMCGG